MEHLIAYLKQRAAEDWLVGNSSREFYELTEQLYLNLSGRTHSDAPPKILLAESNPIRFLAGFIAACAAECPVFLCNPNWVDAEWQQVFNLVQPDLIWGQCFTPLTPLNRESGVSTSENFTSHCIMIPTGGSSGQIRFAIHTWETLTASVQGFAQYFQVAQVNSFCVLPLYHVSGLMQFMRSLTTGGRFVILPFKALEQPDRDRVDTSTFFISLVPTQLQRLLQHSPRWLSQFYTVLLGGSPAWQELLDNARSYNIPLAPTYGMTETASLIAAVKPNDFLEGNNTSGQILPHADVKIYDNRGNRLAANQTGAIAIQADSLKLGYYPQLSPHQQPFSTDDLGLIDENGYLTVLGRNSYKIITGGENVFPAEVESAIRATQLVTDISVIGLPDHHWGQVVTAIYVAINPNVSSETLSQAIQNHLSKFKQPKYWIPVATLPRNAQGKLNREKLHAIAQAWLQEHNAANCR